MFRPEKLIIEGAFSYIERTEIDFRPLLESGIFGIFGKVGSGKSSILDAITYCLYGNISRLTKQDAPNYSMMNLSCDRMELDFTFTNDGERYRVKVNKRRNSRNFDEITGSTFVCTQFVNGEEIPVCTEKNAVPGVELLGLSLENFSRSVIIPQGKFVDFIAISKTERIKMMKELFGLEKYDLYNNAKRVHDEYAQECELLQRQIDSIEESYPDLNKLIKESKTCALQIISEQEALDNKRNEAEKNLKLLQMRFDEAKEAAKIVSRLNELKEKLSEFEQKREELARFQVFFDHIEPVLKQKETKTKENNSIMADLEAKLNQKQQLLIETEKNQNLIENQKSAVKKAETDYKELHKYRNLIRKQELEAESVELNKEIITILDRIQTLENESKELEKLCAQLPELETELQELKESVHIRRFASDIKNKAAAIEESVHAQLELKTKIVEGLDAKLKQATDLLKQQKLEQKQIIQDNAARAVVRTLKDGDNCPVCGNIYHVDSNNDRSAHTQDELELKLKKCEQQIDELNNNLAEIQKLQAQNSVCTAELEKKNIEITKLTEQQNKDKSEFIKISGIDFDNYNFTDEKTTEDQIKKLESTIKQSNNSKDNLHKIQTEIEVKRESEKNFRNHVERNYQEISKLELPDNADNISDTIQFIKNIETLYETGLRELEQLQKNSAKTENTKAALNGEITVLQNRSEELKSDISDIEKSLISELEKHKIDKTEISFFLENREKKSVLEKETATFFKDYDYYNRIFDSRMEDKLKLAAEPEEIEQASIELNKLTVQYNTKVEQRVSLEKDLKIYIAEADKIKSLKSRHSDNSEYLEASSGLLKVFRGSGFVNYAAAFYLEELVAEANRVFSQLTGGSLEIMLTPDNDFRIRDYLNSGKERSIKTLSGGQTFMAAFSLAAALSDRISKGNSFFFMDEGFGSLDSESLEIFLHALKKFAANTISIGIISHVEDLKSEIPVYLQIENRKDRGSVVLDSSLL